MADSDWKKLSQTTPLHEKILEVLEKELNFTKITRVQNAVIPIFAKNNDVIVKVINFIKRHVLAQEKLFLL